MRPMRNLFRRYPNLGDYLDIPSREARTIMIERGYHMKVVDESIEKLKRRQLFLATQRSRESLERFTKANTSLGISARKATKNMAQLNAALKQLEEDNKRLKEEQAKKAEDRRLKECRTAWAEAHDLLCPGRCDHRNPYR